MHSGLRSRSSTIKPLFFFSSLTLLIAAIASDADTRTGSTTDCDLQPDTTTASKPPRPQKPDPVDSTVTNSQPAIEQAAAQALPQGAVQEHHRREAAAQADLKALKEAQERAQKEANRKARENNETARRENLKLLLEQQEAAQKREREKQDDTSKSSTQSRRDSTKTPSQELEPTVEKTPLPASPPAPQIDFAQAAASLRETAGDLDQAIDGLPQGQLQYLKRMYWNARDLAAQAPSDYADQEFSSAASGDGLVQRIVLYNALPKNEQQAVTPKLKLTAPVQLQLADGTKKEVTVFHNGFLEKKSGKPTCTSMVSNALPSEARKGGLSSLDYRTIWIYLQRKTLPKPPRYKKGRAEQLKILADAFEPLDLYAGEPLTAGDLLIERLPEGVSGHVFIVRSFNPQTMKVEIIEDLEGSNELHERTFSLLDPTVQQKEKKQLRKGLWALRVRPFENSVCTDAEEENPQSTPAPKEKPSDSEPRGTAGVVK